MMNLNIRETPKRRYSLNGYLNKLTAMTTIENGENGNKAAIIINAPPHFLTSVIYLPNTRSE